MSADLLVENFAAVSGGRGKQKDGVWQNFFVVTLKAELFSFAILAAIRLLNIPIPARYQTGRGATPHSTANNCTAHYYPQLDCTTN